MKKSQSSVEIMIIFSLLLLVFSILFLSADTVRGSFVASQDQRVARMALDDITSVAQRVYVQGEGAQQTIRVQLPRTTQNITIRDNTFELYVFGQDQPSTIRTVQFSVSGSIQAQSGLTSITARSDGLEVIFS